MTQSTSSKLILEIQDGVALVTINNPPANTWDEESLPALEALVDALDANVGVRALVITGQGEKFFSAGADLNLFADGRSETARRMSDAFGSAFERLASFSGVSVAAINGWAMGGGLECALACDIRVVEAQARMSLPEAAVGLLPCGGGTQLLPWLVGEGWAKRIILCGERVNAETAERIGLCEEIAETGQSLARATEIARSAANQSPDAVAACKGLVHKARHSSVDFLTERDAFVALFDGANQREGVNAFLEKRSPVWT